jgi:hypothetical protein
MLLCSPRHGWDNLTANTTPSRPLAHTLTGQKLYELVTPSPSKVTQWPIQDVWYASNAFLNFLNTYVGNSTVAPMNDLRTNNAAALTYFTNLLKPGGRGCVNTFFCVSRTCTFDFESQCPHN